MTLSNNETLTILQQSQTVPTWVTKAREYNKELEALINGVDFISLLKIIEHKEDTKQLEARQKYAHSIKDMFDRVMRAVDNVYSATGGSKRYASKDDEVSTESYEKLIQKVSTIRDQKPLEKWLQENWMKLYRTDPNGVILYEYESETEKLYPTYKNINSIRNYKSDGQNIEWILFEPEKKDNGVMEWRLIDDEYDYIITQSTTVSFTINEDKSFKHPFGYVPGIIISDIIKIGTEQRLSPLDSVLELAKESLRDESHKSMFKFLLWDPIFWRYKLKCPTCGGSGKKGVDKCPDCNGKGLYTGKDITNSIDIGVPDEKEQPIVTPNIAGFIVPPVEIMAEFNKENELLENKIYSTVWGTINYQKMYSGGMAEIKTATEIVYDTAPQIARLNMFADVAQWVEWRLTELAANFIYPSKPKDKRICTITYGRNYIIEPLEVLYDRYTKYVAAGLNSALCDKALEEIICSKYKTDPIGLEEELKRLKVEPFIHYTIEQIKVNYSADAAQRKMLFQSWWQNEADKDDDVEELIIAFDTYCTLKLTPPAAGKQPVKVRKEPHPDGSIKYFDETTGEEITDEETIKQISGV